MTVKTQRSSSLGIENVKVMALVYFLPVGEHRKEEVTKQYPGMPTHRS